MSHKLKVDLTLMKKLISELEVMLASSQAIRNMPNADKSVVVEFIVEMSKAAGIAAGISQEGAALMGDIANEVKGCSQPVSSKDPIKNLEDYLGLDKIKGYGNGGGSQSN